MNEHRNLLLAMVLSLAILFGFQALYSWYKPATPPPSPTEKVTVPNHTTAEQNAVSATGVSVDMAPKVQGPSLIINTPRLHGNIHTVGGRLDNLTLVDYHETTDPKSSEIHLLSPSGNNLGYFADFGWTSSDTAQSLPNATTLWQSNSKALQPDSPVVLRWNNGRGLNFTRQIAVDKNYMFTVTMTVQNTGAVPVSLAPYGQIIREGNPKIAGYRVIHEGPLGVMNGSLEELSYKDLSKDNKPLEQKTTGGWAGITDKYWLVALVPNQTEPTTVRMQHMGALETGRYVVDTVGQTTTLAPGQSLTTEMRLFAGAKEVKLISAYAHDLNITRFDLAIDFGWFYFLTKPLFYALDFLGHVLGNFGLALLTLTVLVRLAMLPLATKSLKSMARMKQLEPQLSKIRELYSKDQARMSQEIMALYKREKVTPFGGCLPMLLQIPVFFALYKVLFVTLEMRHAPFIGWIHDLSAPDPTSIFNFFILIHWTPPAMLMIGVWPILMGISMFLQQRLNPAPADPIQKNMMGMMPVLMTYMLAKLPAGLVIYWTWSNVLAILQQLFMSRWMKRKKG